MPMLQVAALHYYIISDFRQCIPLPVLYVLIPGVIASLTWKHMEPVITGVVGNNRYQDNPERETKRKVPANFRSRTIPVFKSPETDFSPGFDYADFNWNYTDHPLLRNEFDAYSRHSR